ncbi:MAG: aminotransferase class I/II-fold pyridoxal phosphate-dependent enzyme [Thermoleophilia bacterium]
MAQYRITGASAHEIASSIERAVEGGALAPGEALPSVRSIAGELGVSPTTVSAALGDLRSRGLVVTHRRSRSQVSWRPPLGGALQRPTIPAGARDLASGNPDPALLPDPTPFLRRLDPPTQLYGGEPMLAELRGLAEAEFAAAGIAGGETAVTSGALDAIERALQANTRPGDLVAVEDPGFAGLFDLLRALGLALRPVPIDGKGMLPDELAAALDEGAAAVVLNPRGQNPTGASLDVRRAKELRAALKQAPSAMVVEDDHLGPIAGVPRISLSTGRQRWASALSLAKSLGPDLRLAVLAGDAQTISRVRGRQAVGPQWVSHLLQGLVAAMWADEAVGVALEHAAATYRERRERFLEALGERGIEVGATAGIAVWIPVPEEAPVVQSLLAQGWAVMSGAPFRLQSERAIRVTTSTLAADEAGELAEAIQAALRPSSATRTA